MDNFKISQSAFKSFYTPEIEFCPMQYYKKYVVRERVDNPTDAQLEGQVFEHKCIGATVSGNEPELPKVNIKNRKPNGSASKAELQKYLTKKNVSFDPNATNDALRAIISGMPDDYTKGEPSASERAIDEVVKLFKETDQHEGIKTIDIQLYLDNGEWNGVADRRTVQVIDGEEKIQLRDLKFASTKYDREYFNGWSQPAHEAFNRSRKVNGGYLFGFLEAGTLTDRINYIQSLTMYERSIIQAVHYCIIYNDLHDVWPQFYIDVYGKSGWQRIKKVVIDLETVENHHNAIDIFKSDLEYYFETGFDYDPKYPACRGCDYAEQCPVFKKFPEVEETVFQ